MTAVVALLVLGGARLAGAGPEDSRPCAELAARYADQVPTGWRLDCLAEMPESWRAAAGDRPAASMSDRDERRIVVVEGQDRAYTEAAIAHEIAHAEASSWPARLRVAVAQAMGAPRWAVAGDPTSAVEVFAESSVRCRGLPTHSAHPLVPCDLVEAARTAGGAVAPLPVTGTHPTS